MYQALEMFSGTRWVRHCFCVWKQFFSWFSYGNVEAEEGATHTGFAKELMVRPLRDSSIISRMFISVTSCTFCLHSGLYDVWFVCSADRDSRGDLQRGGSQSSSSWDLEFPVASAINLMINYGNRGTFSKGFLLCRGLGKGKWEELFLDWVLVFTPHRNHKTLFWWTSVKCVALRKLENTGLLGLLRKQSP